MQGIHMLVFLSLSLLCHELVNSETLSDLTTKVKVLESLVVNGLRNIPGRDGRDGLRGPPGKDGTKGDKGDIGGGGCGVTTAVIAGGSKPDPRAVSSAPKGNKGETGPTGPQGTKGEPGTNSRLKGERGPPGWPGGRGPAGSTGQKGAPGRDAGSVTYVRWGRTTCPSGAELVYAGRVGGTPIGHSGGGASYQCLPKQPIYDGYYTGSGQGYSYMYNAEYEVHRWNPFAPHVQNDDDVPCVVCLVRGQSALLMIPARNVCPSGWRREYYGYLMATATGGHNSDFVCVDRNAEAVPGTRGAKTGAQMYFVDGRCLGHLECGPYVHNAELTCAICTI